MRILQYRKDHRFAVTLITKWPINRWHILECFCLLAQVICSLTRHSPRIAPSIEFECAGINSLSIQATVSMCHFTVVKCCYIQHRENIHIHITSRRSISRKWSICHLDGGVSSLMVVLIEPWSVVSVFTDSRLFDYVVDRPRMNLRVQRFRLVTCSWLVYSRNNFWQFPAPSWTNAKIPWKTIVRWSWVHLLCSRFCIDCSTSSWWCPAVLSVCLSPWIYWRSRAIFNSLSLSEVNFSVGSFVGWSPLPTTLKSFVLHL